MLKNCLDYQHPLKGTGTGIEHYWTVLNAVLQIRIWDPVPFYPKDPGSGCGIRDDFFSGSRISDPGSLSRPKFKILPLKMAKNRKN
jgi:hypothetical protein